MIPSTWKTVSRLPEQNIKLGLVITALLLPPSLTVEQTGEEEHEGTVGHVPFFHLIDFIFSYRNYEHQTAVFPNV